jgi:hypothetical protein
MRPAKTLILAVPLATLAIAGCGGGDDEPTTTAATTTEATALSKAELISQGDAICAEVNAAIGAVAGSGAEAPDQVVQVSDLYLGMIDSIKDLGVPEEEAGYAEFIAAAEDLSKVESEVKLAAEREETAAVDEAAPALEEFEEEAGDYGFEDCGEEPTAPISPGTDAPVEEEAEEGGVEVAPEEVEEEAPVEEEAAPEEVAPETGGAGGGSGIEEPAPEAGGGESGGSSGGVGPG